MSFIVSTVTDEQELKEIYRLRFKVYCEEWKFENPDKYPDGLETDEFDEHAVHFAVKDNADKIVGTARLILDSEEGFPIEKYCQVNIGTEEFSRGSIAEISRLAIIRNFRRRSEDRYIYGPDEDRRSIGSFGYQHKYSGNKTQYRRTEDRYRYKQSTSRIRNEFQSDRRNRHELVTSLYKAIYHESKRRNLGCWYAVMTKGLIILLNKFGIKFQPVGDAVDYHGIRTPYLGEIAKIEQEVMQEYPEVYEEFIKEL